MKCVYVAGAYSSTDVLTVFANMRRGIQAASQVIEAGFSPFTPWTDVLLHLQAGYDLKTCYGISMAWLERSDAVIVVPEGAEQSHGTQAELARAEELGIPIFHRATVEMAIEAMRKHFGG